MVTREREDNIYYARLAEQGERYEDMIEYMGKVANVSINTIWIDKKILESITLEDLVFWSAFSQVLLKFENMAAKWKTLNLSEQIFSN